MTLKTWISVLIMSTLGTGALAQSGQFTTAAEVKPILDATRGNWVAVREYEGQDYLYVTHLWSWRCGMLGIGIGLNGGAMEMWPMPPCHVGTNAPNAVLEGDGLPVKTFPLGSIQNIQVIVLLDDGTDMKGRFERRQVMIP